MLISGVVKAKTLDDVDPLIKRAIILYCKANFGWDNPESERLQQSYVMLKMHMTLAANYNTEVVVV